MQCIGPMCEVDHFVANRNTAIVIIATSTTATSISIEPSPPSGEKPKCVSINCIGPVLAVSAANTTAANTMLMVAKPTATAPLADLLSARSSFIARLLQKTADPLRGGTHATAKGQRTGGKSTGLAGQLLWG